jgi:hypothetical protein
MPQKILVIGLGVLVTTVWSAARMSAQDGVRPASRSATMDHVSTAIGTYCSSCHVGQMRSPSGLLLERLDTARISTSPELWSRAYRQLQAGAMPPVGAPRPDRATVATVLVAVEQALGAQPRPRAAVTNNEVATRLATILWNSAPDTALLQEAQRNGFSDQASLERQVQRMLADDRARTFVSRFFFPWLQLDTLGESDPDKQYFPDYDVSLRDSFARETELFLLSQLRDGSDPIELWSADYTFLNEQLARHYGIPNLTGLQFRRTSLPAPERAGLLGQGSILMMTSRHQHGVDAAYTINGAAGLRQVLRQHSEAFRTTITEKLLVYARHGVGDRGQRNASIARAGPPDSAQHPAAPVVHSHRRRRAGRTGHLRMSHA